MFFKRTGAQGPGSPLEVENRALLIAIGVLSLLIFMDRQAGKQIDLRAEKILKSDIENIIESGKKGAQDRFDSAVEVTETHRERVKEQLLEEKKDRIEPVKQSAEELLKKSTDGVDSATTEIREQIEKASSYRQLGELKPVTGGGEEAMNVNLYFIRFSSGSSEIVQVTRTISVKSTIRDVIALLQKGPTERESGLLNAFDDRIQIHSIALSDGILRIDVDSGIHRMSQSIIKDRMHQLLFTVFQFKQVKAVELLVDGKTVEFLGKGDQSVGVPELLGRPSRETGVY